MSINKWKKVPLESLCHKIGDGLHGTPHYDESSDVLFINGNNFKSGKILTFKDTKKVASIDYKSHYIELNDNTLLLSINGTIGNMAFYNNEKVILGKSAAYLNFKTEINQFYYYYFQLKDVQHYFYNVATGSTIKNLGLETIQDFEVPYPDENEWRAITKILSDLDKKIELNNKINAELEAMAKLIYDYWFVQFDFPDANGKSYKSSGGKMVYNEILKREIPDGWEVKELYSIAKNIMGQSPKGETYNSERIGMPLLNGPADYKNGSLYGRLYTTEPTRLCKKDDMVLCIRATIGKLVYSEGEFCLGRGVAAVRPNDKTYSELIYFLLKQEIERFKKQATGSIIKGITKDDLTNSKCLLPKETLVLSFHEKVKPMFDKQRLQKEENQKLTELRDWLLPMLMNGQVTVKESA
jgi:type I restriction enzyme, S subunit